MPILISALDKSSPIQLCEQLLEKITLMISQGILKPGTRLPSCRKLAAQMAISNNTVVSAYQNLIARGMVESRPRRGYFVHHQLLRTELASEFFPANEQQKITRLFELLKPVIHPSLSQTIQRPENWAEYPFPFVCNQMDMARFPLTDWRTCCYKVLDSHHATQISCDYRYSDCKELVEQIRTRILPQRGVIANENEILITSGATQALYLISNLFGSQKNKIAVEDPCYPDARNIFDQFFGGITPIGLDNEGMLIDEQLSSCQLAYITPNHQFPTSIRMSVSRRRQLLDYAKLHKLVIIEDDYDGETDFDTKIEPALRSQQGGDQVIYIGSLSKSHSPGLRVGYMVASPDFINEARALRGMMIRHLPPLIQVATAQFIRQGYHDALLSKLRRIYKRRSKVASQALSQYFSDMQISHGSGGTNFMITAPAHIDLTELGKYALDLGVVIENINPCFNQSSHGKNKFRLGVSAISTKKIVPGIKRLREAYEKLYHESIQV